MTSQPNPSTSGKPHLTLTEDGLRIDAVDTLRAVWDAFAAGGDFALGALLASAPGSAWFITTPELKDAYTEGPIAVLPENARRLANLAVVQVAATATAAGCDSSAQRVWADRIDDTFASEPRLIEVLRVSSPWQFIRITAAEDDTGVVVSRAEVAAGDYLVLSSGHRPSVRAVCRLERIPTSAELAAVDGFRADRISAECSRCHRHWAASGGQYDFAPVDDTRLTWRLDHTELGLVTTTGPCPVPDCAGRITFGTDLP